MGLCTSSDQVHATGVQVVRSVWHRRMVLTLSQTQDEMRMNKVIEEEIDRGREEDMTVIHYSRSHYIWQ